MDFFKEKENKRQDENTLWVERYRPRSLDDYVGNDFLKEKIKQYITNSDIPHLLFWGKQGTGKTSIAKIIVNSINCDYMMINASDENQVEVIRNKIKGFASTVGFKPLKVIILDECLDENTLVTVLRKGEEVKLPIKDLDEHNDLVKSWNVKKQQIQWRPFSHWDKGEQDVFEIEFGNGEVIVCTEDHKWYVEDKNKEVKVVKTRDLHKYKHILSPQ